MPSPTFEVRFASYGGYWLSRPPDYFAVGFMSTRPVGLPPRPPCGVETSGVYDIKRKPRSLVRWARGVKGKPRRPDAGFDRFLLAKTLRFASYDDANSAPSEELPY